LFFAYEGILVLCLRFQHDQWKTFFIEEQKVNIAMGRFLKVIAHGIEINGFECNAGFQADISGFALIGKESPAGVFEQFVDFDSSIGFFVGHVSSFAAYQEWIGRLLRIPVKLATYSV